MARIARWGLALTATFMRPMLLSASEEGSDAVCTADSTSPGCRADYGAEPKASGSKASAAHSVAAREEKPQAMADLITQEMEELESYIKLCEDRISMLKDVQAIVEAGHDLPLPEPHVRALREKLPLLSEIVVDPESSPTAAPEDFIVTKAVIPQTKEKVLAVKFLPLKAKADSSGSSPGPPLPPAMLVAAQVDGGVRLFLPNGELVHTFSANHAQPVRNLAVSQLPGEEHLVATIDAAGVVLLHRVTVKPKRLTKEEKQALKSGDGDRVSQFLGSQVNVTSHFHGQLQAPEGDEAPEITALVMTATQQGSRYIVTGDSKGAISFYTKNGTMKSKLEATTNPESGIEGLVASGGQIFFRAGAEFGFADLEKGQVKHMDCPGFEGKVVAATTDEKSSSRVLVVDEASTVWVFALKASKGQKAGADRECRVELRFASGTTKGGVDVASLRGFVLALENGQATGQWSLAMLNMTAAGRRGPGVTSPVVWRHFRSSPIRSWAVHKRGQGDLVAVVSDNEVEVMELLMSVYTPPAQDSVGGNYKIVLVVVALVGVLGFQFFKQKNKLSGSAGGGGAGSGKNFDFGKSDLAALKKKLDADKDKKMGDDLLAGLAREKAKAKARSSASG
eukprot:TRINITY_DN12654_c0_g1_i1.p1 TRINITY_DN12654_c0_g1~~TRINITY_DN12654_c0_g1_i1.p1  ORF type:complete len:622 (-),score=181.30 TRINITY_DN12654_c0_g1_i1:158-2023(-)